MDERTEKSKNGLYKKRKEKKSGGREGVERWTGAFSYLMGMQQLNPSE